MIFEDNAGNIKQRPNICEIISTAFDSKFSYYDVRSAPNMIPNDVDNFSNANDDYLFNGINYTVKRIINARMELGFFAKYNPNKTLLHDTVVPMNTANNFEWTSVSGYTIDNAQPTGATLTSNAGNDANLVNVACCDVAGAQIDPNGGYFSFRVSQMGAVPTGSHNHIMIVGLTQGLGNGVNVVPQNGLDEQSYVCGVKFSHNLDGGLVLNILDADGNLEPATEINTFTENDVFFIRLCRSTDAGVARTYNFSVWKNVNDVWNNTTSLIFQSEVLLSSPLDYYMTTSSNVTGMRIQDCKFIPISQDSKVQLDTNFGNPDLVGDPINITTVYQYDTIYLATFEKFPEEAQGDFFLDLGIRYLNADANPTFSSLGNGYIYKYNIPRQSQQIATVIGSNNIFDVITTDVINGTSVLNYRTNQSIPRMLEVTLKDLNNTTYQGSLVGSNRVTNANSISRVVGVIMVGDEYLTKSNSFDINISYEPYNLIYRKLYNVNDIPINQFNVKIGYKNFITNQNQDIKEINGICKLELHIKNK